MTDRMILETLMASMRLLALREAANAVWGIRGELGCSNHEWAKQAVDAIQALEQQR